MEVMEKVSQKETWAKLFERGKVVWISEDRKSANGAFKLFTIRNEKNELVSFQAWDWAYVQLKNEIIVDGDIVEIQGWPHYYKQDGENKLAFKTDCLCPVGPKIRGVFEIRSEWLKGESRGKEYQQFTCSPVNGQGLVMHCRLPKDSPMMRRIQTGMKVELVGTYIVEQNCPGDRFIVDVCYMEEYRE